MQVRCWNLREADLGFRADPAMFGGCATRGCVELTRRRWLSGSVHLKPYGAKPLRESGREPYGFR